ncbi:MAG: hypothetical protein ABIH89_02790 [Elusimicrobiota bacterium]
MNLPSNLKYACLVLTAVCCGCATTYNQKLSPVKSDIRNRQYDKAVLAFSKTGIPENDKNSLLYHLETGLLYHLAGEYKLSNRFLENAEWISDELYTKSISQETASLVTSDNILPYRGEYFEYLFTNYYKLLNYIYLGNLEDALVEVRRINHKLSLFKKDDAFMHYMTAILYQYNMQDSDAFIEYMKAYKAYRNDYPDLYGTPYPRQLTKDIAVFAHESRFPRVSEFPPEVLSAFTPPAEYGTVVFILETGFIPAKQEVRMDASIPQDYKKKYKNELKDTYFLTVSVPHYLPETESIQSAAVEINGQIYSMDLVEDLGSLARKSLEDKHDKIIAKAIARAVTKYITYRAVKGKGTKDDNSDNLRKILGATVNIFGAATEHADTRSWLTLPNRIFFTRAYLDPGKYSFRMSMDHPVTSETETFDIKKGELKFIVLRQ